MKYKNVNRSIKSTLVYILFTGPAVLLFVSFILIPLIMALRYSLFDWNGISKTYNFVGLSNYVNVFSEKAFIESIGFSFLYTLIITIILNLSGLLIALALNSKLKFRTALRGAYFLPMVISAVVVGYIWNMIIVRFFPYIGDLTGIELLTKSWFSYPNTAFVSLVIAATWQSFGYFMMVYLAGLQSVPTELMEAAEIDGAGAMKKFFRITLPMIKPSITICIFLGLISGLKSFDLNYSLTGGGPFGSTTSMALQIYLDAFKRDLLSYASAKAIIFSIIFAVISFTQVALMKKGEVEL